MTIVVYLVVFAAAFLLFVLQPLAGRLVLPHWGGAPAVWTTCLLFFQTALLVGYGYVHGLFRCLPPRLRRPIHMVMLLAPLLALPLAVEPPAAATMVAHPATSLLAVLTASVGGAVIVLATTTPLMQAQLADINRSMRNPYTLYAASNAGSFLGLFAYPVVIEPWLTLPQQRLAWSVGYAVLTVLAAACLVPIRRAVPPAQERTSSVLQDRWHHRGRWIALAAAPASVLAGATQALTTDVAPMPLLWTIPLGLYLLTYVIAFALDMPTRLEWWLSQMTLWLLPAFALSLGTAFFWWLGLVHLVVVVLVGWRCHGALARSRPPKAHLTEFYFCMALGGVVGTLLCAVAAPWLFHSAAEYPLIVFALVALFDPPLARRGPWCRFDAKIPLVLASLVVGVLIVLRPRASEVHWLALVLLACTPTMLIGDWLGWPRRRGALIAVVLALGFVGSVGDDDVIAAERSFFGIHRVKVDRVGQVHRLVHGSTIHGWQSLEEAKRCEPMGYFARWGPLGEIFSAIDPPQDPATGKPRPLAVIGLGTGSLVAYRRPGQQVVFLEIDPTVKRLAEDSRWFTFLSHCGAGAVEVRLGDGRLLLEGYPDGSLATLMADAFSSDAVPVHLLTREALDLYFRKLAVGGIAIFHITNRYLDLEPVLAGNAEALGLCVFVREAGASAPGMGAPSMAEGRFVVIARVANDVQRLWARGEWQVYPARGRRVEWTDASSSLLPVIRWRGRDR